MAAVASNHMPESFRGSNSDQFAESGPSFTAVNGTASPTPPVKAKSNQEAQKESTDETAGRPTRPNSQQEPADSPAPSRPSQTSSQQERGPSPGPNSSMDRPTPASGPNPNPNSNSNPNPNINLNTTQRQEANDESKTHYVSSHSRTPSSQQSKTATTSPQKRKRSMTDDYDNLNNTPTYHSHALPNSPERQRMYSTENGRAHELDNGSPPTTYPPLPEHARPQPPELYPRPDRHQMARNDYDPRVDPNIANIAPAPRPYYSEARMAEALQRENRNYDAMGPRDQFASPEDDDEHNAQQYADYGTNRGSQSGMDMDRKRRKRVFSNRTKTGCMTCRRRKKKCDEQHPECKSELYRRFTPCLSLGPCSVDRSVSSFLGDLLAFKTLLIDHLARQQLSSWRVRLRGIYNAEHMAETC